MTTTGEDFIMSMDDVELKEQKRAEKLSKLESGELVYIKYVFPYTLRSVMGFDGNYSCFMQRQFCFQYDYEKWTVRV